MRSRSAALIEAWDAWLFAAVDLRALALFRMGWAAAMFITTASDWTHPAVYSSDRYHVPLLAWVVPVAAQTVRFLLQLSAVACVATFIGALPRLAALVVIAVHGYLFSVDLLQFRNHVYLGLLLGLLLSLSPCGQALSVASWLRKTKGSSSPMTATSAAAQLVKAQVLVVYAYSVLNKLRASFLDGFTLQQELPLALRDAPLARWLHAPDGPLTAALTALLHDNFAMAACSWLVVAIEGFVLVGLLHSRTRRAAAAVGLLLHAGIFLLMNVRTFGLLMVCSYPLFLAPRSSA